MELHREKNVATYIVFPLVDANGALVSASANPDSEIDAWEDNGAPDGFADCTNEATEIGVTGIYYLLVTQTEMNNDYIVIQVKSDDALTQVILISTKLREAVETVDGVVDAILVDTGTTIPASLTTIDNEIATIDTVVDAILVDTDTMEADLKTYMDAIETNLDGDIAAVKGDTAAILIDTDTMEADLTTEIDANETKIDTAITKIDAIKAETAVILTDTGTTLDGYLKEIAGLVNKHVYVDTTVHDGDGNLTSARYRIYDSAANATTHGAGGLLYTLTLTATYTGGNLTTCLTTVA